MDVRLPNLGEGADSGTVVSLMVKEGDSVAKDQPILELENEKAVAAIPSPVSGRITSIRVKEGDKLTVGQVFMSVTEDARARPTAPATPRRDQPRPMPETGPETIASETPAVPELPKAPGVFPEPAAAVRLPEPLPDGLGPAASPAIRRMARELGIDLRRVRGSERGGRIILADLRTYIQTLEKLALQAKPASVTAPAPVQPIDFSRWGPIRRKSLSPLRQVIRQRMTENWTTIPHVTQFDRADLTVVTALKSKYAADYERKGARLTLTSFALKAVLVALDKHPIFNASLDERSSEIVFKDYHHIGVAVDTEQGLMVPVVREADKKDLVTLSRELAELADKARHRKLTLDEMKGGTFTISNQGGIGGGPFTPIINKPEVAILGLGRGALTPVVKGEKIEARLLLPMALSYDHRVIDGADAARFMATLVQALENFPETELQ